MPRRWAISAAIQTAPMEAPSCSCTPSREARAERSPLCLRASSMAVGNLGGDPDGADGSAFVQLYAVEGGKGGEIALVLKSEFDGGGQARRRSRRRRWKRLRAVVRRRGRQGRRDRPCA